MTFSLNSDARLVHFCSAPWPNIPPPLALSCRRCRPQQRNYGYGSRWWANVDGRVVQSSRCGWAAYELPTDSSVISNRPIHRLLHDSPPGRLNPSTSRHPRGCVGNLMYNPYLCYIRLAKEATSLVIFLPKVDIDTDCWLTRKALPT